MIMFGISFLNSFFLWGLAAASLPIIIHLIKRNRAIKLPFAAMRFLQIDPNERFRSQKLKQILLLLMRIAAVALLALAFTRPFFSDAETLSFWGRQPRAAVILVDNSLSMGYKNNFQTAVEKARTTLNSFQEGDEFTLMQFANETEVVFQFNNENIGSLGDFENRFKQTNEATNYMRALHEAETFLLESDLASKEIYLISDFQKTAWDDMNPHVTIDEGIKINLVPVKKEGSENVAVTDVHISIEGKSGSGAKVFARLKNYGDEIRKASAMLFINSKKISQRNVALTAGEEKIVQFNRIPLTQGTVAGHVELEVTDQLAVDNRFYFVSENRARSDILAVNGEPHRNPGTDELFFVERAINLPDSKFKLTETTSRDLHTHDFSNYRAVLLANVKDLDRDSIKRITYYVRGGGGLILALGDRINANLFNKIFEELMPAKLIGLAFSFVNRRSGAILAEVDYQHPIFKLFSDPGQIDPSIAQFYQYFQTEPLHPESVLASFDDGSPAVLERRVGKGKVIMFTSSLDTEWNNLPVKALYLPLLHKTLDYVGSEKKGQKSFLVGNPLPLRSFWDKSTTAEWTVLNPSGERTQTTNNIFESTYEPGIYEIHDTKSDRKLASFAVNVDPSESDLTFVTNEELAQKFDQPQGQEQIQTAAITLDNSNSKKEKSQKLWRFVILAVLLLLIGETWLANRTYR